MNKKIPIVAVAALVVAIFALKGQMEADRPYITVEPLQNIKKAKGSAFNLAIGNSGEHPATDIRLKYILLADCSYQEIAKDDVTIVNDVVKDHDRFISFGTSIDPAKKDCVTKTNLLALVFEYKDPHIWDHRLINWLIKKKRRQQFFFAMSVRSDDYQINPEGWIKLNSPEIRNPISVNDVQTAYGKYIKYFESNKEWLHKWNKEAFPVMMDLIN